MIQADADSSSGRPRTSAVDLDDIAARGDKLVAALRDRAGVVDKLLVHNGPELLDLQSTPPATRQHILDDVERISKLLLLDRYWTHAIGKLILDARRTRRGKPVRVLDVGAGAGGLLFRLDEWARRRRVAVELIGLDYDPVGVDGARRRAAEEGRKVEFRAGDMRRLSDFADGSVDVAVTTFALHHLTAGAVANVLHELDRVAAVNFFAFDLRRTLGAVPALWALLRVARFDAPTCHDAMVSLRRGYSLAEIEALLELAGVPHYQVVPVVPAYQVATRA